jgi:uncharacterized membrane protein
MDLTVIYWLTGILLLIIAIVFYLFPPANRNGFYGYRTAASMKDDESWAFANKFSSKVFLITSIMTVLVQVVVYLLIGVSNATVLGVNIFAASDLLFVILLTEQALKNRHN